MKLFYIINLSLFTFLFSFNLTAQPTFNMDDIGFQIGDVIQMDSVEYFDMSNMTGPNMIWDFNEITFTNNVLNAEVMPIEDVISPIDFGDANTVLKYTIEGFEFFQYYTKNANNVQFKGYFSEFSGNVISNVFDNSQEIYNTPMSYGSTASDTYSATTTSFGGIGELTGSLTSEVVGYGTLILDGETYSDVLLMNFMTDETIVNIFGGAEFVTVSSEDSYFFWKAGYHLPLLTFSHYISDGGILEPEEEFAGTFLLQQTSVGIDELETIDFSIYPNPTLNHKVTIQFAEENISEIEIALFDPLGRVHSIESAYFNGDNNQLQVELPENLSSGVYKLTISGDKIIGSKSIVIR